MRKLRPATCLTVDDERVLAGLGSSVRRVGRGDILLEGTEPQSFILILEGWVGRYKQLENGGRKITTIFLPGDLCEPFGALPKFLDYSLAAFTPVLMASLAPKALRQAAADNARIEQALWWDLLLTDALAREHMVSLGRRSAIERLGHFFCEIYLRLNMIGLADRASYPMPLTQSDLADLLGLTPVHINRSLQEMRGHNLLSLRDRRITIHDLRALRELSMFDPTYLPQTDTAHV